MGNQYTRFSINIYSEDQKDVLIALLSNWGIEGFEEEEKTLIASGRKDETDETAIEGYLTENKLSFSKSVIDEQNWNAVWESNFEPVQVEDFVGIRAHFHPPFNGVEHEITITPKMSFGTGHHATTYMMMLSMRQLPIHDSTVFDFGTGTGILAILAEKMGAKSILATDYDDWCIENGTENIAQNSCSRISIEKSDHPPTHQQFDVVLANINKNIIVQYFKELADITKYEGRLLLSGLLTADEKDIVNIALTNKLTVEQKLERNGWIALILGKNC